MRTYTHGVIGYLLYLKGTKEQQLLAIIGAMIPDIFLAIGFVFHFLGDARIVEMLHTFFHHSALHTITEYMHSFMLVIPLLIAAYFFYKRIMPFFVGMLSHVVVDLLTHQRAAYNHFLPFPLEPVRSIVSYTSLWFTIVEHVLLVVFFVWLYSQRTR